MGATERQQSLANVFPDAPDFRYDFELSPILSAVLQEYDESDTERPRLDTLINFTKELSDLARPIDWSLWRQVYRNRSPLFLELISYFQQDETRQSSGTATMHNLLEQPDALQKWTPVQWAAFTGRVHELTTLLENGADAFAITSSGRNILHQAAESAIDEVLAYLLRHRYDEKGLDINLQDIWNESPLHLAAEKSPRMVELLLQHGADVNARSGDGLVPLHYCRILRGEKRLDCLALLLNQAECPINDPDNVGRSPIFSYLDSPACVKLFLDHGAEVSLRDNDGRTVLHRACVQGRPLTLEVLLSHCSNEVVAYEDNEGDTALFTSFRSDSKECARVILRRAPIGSATDKDGWSLLHHAVNLGDVITLKLVLSIPGIDLHAVTRQGQSVFDVANESGTITGPIGKVLMDLMEPRTDELNVCY